MNREELIHILSRIKDCEDYLNGKVHGPEIKSIAQNGAMEAVIQYQVKLLTMLEESGLQIEKPE